ncbi:MAG TPA: hypothetical protein VGM52_01040 [Herbaspirillum sp.]
MKKTLLIASLLAVVTLAACGKKEEAVPVTPAVVETPAPAAAPAADAPAADAPAAAPAADAPAAPAADAPAAPAK